jgi:hypothetical protein
MTAIGSMFLADPIIEQNGNNARVAPCRVDGFADFTAPTARRRGIHARARSASSPVAQNHAIVAGTASSAAHDELQHASPRTFYATATGINAAVIPGRVAPH